jgi:4-hydroxy-tetrahydrodipicolinate synthase
LILPDWFPVSMEEAILFLRKMESEADGISLILYNPPHAKKILHPEDWEMIKKQIPSLEGLKVFDRNGDPVWFEKVRKHAGSLSVFIPGHRLISGIRAGARGAYSNMACLNPFAAQRWYEMSMQDQVAALELEQRINVFMNTWISPFITQGHFPNHACDRFMALLGGWADVGEALRWPYRSIPMNLVEPVRKEAETIIPEFFKGL